ncbi:MAG: DUF3604 domain-containing protein [Deltaproteobacteria bacterium]|nr:DUF3604 domain-containing protein [Deltaproteobacteria bacterium]
MKNVYFGEQHLHTANSPDAFAMGTRNTPDDAYDFCKGKAIKKSTTGEMVQKRTPYDWCAVTDHAYLMGLLPLTLDPKNPLSKTQMAKLIASGDPKDMDQAFQIIMNAIQAGGSPKGFDNLSVQKSAWDRHKEITNKHNDPGKFTALIAFEWTSIPYGQNLHRNVFFRDDKGPDVTFSAVDSDKEEDLWTYLETQRKMGWPSTRPGPRGGLATRSRRRSSRPRGSRIPTQPCLLTMSSPTSSCSSICSAQAGSAVR